VVYGLSVFRVIKENPDIANLFLFIPLMFILFIFIGSILSFFYQYFFYFFLSILIIYIFIVIIEAARWSKNLLEMPLTFLAILTGNIAPGIGSLLALFNIPIDIRAVYIK